jgi:hypothetical protein
MLILPLSKVPNSTFQWDTSINVTAARRSRRALAAGGVVLVME